MILGGIIPVIVLDNDLGVAIMMFFIAIGVGLLVKNGMDYQEIEKLETDLSFKRGADCCDLQDDYERYQRTFTRKIVAGVSLIIFGVGLMLSSTVCSVSTTPMPLSYFHLSPSALAISSTPALLPELIASC